MRGREKTCAGILSGSYEEGIGKSRDIILKIIYYLDFHRLTNHTDESADSLRVEFQLPMVEVLEVLVRVLVGAVFLA